MPSLNTALFAGWAFAAGVLIPVMAALNGAFGRGVGSTTWAAVILTGVAFAGTLATALAVSGAPPRLEALTGGRAEYYAAGLVVTFYVLTVTYLSPRFGVAPTVLFVVTAQILTAAVIGHFGLLGAPRQSVDLVKAAGLALMLAGLLLSQWPRRG